MPDVPSRLTAALQGRYRIQRELGEGGTVTGFPTEDVRHERKVALKVLRAELAAVPGAGCFPGRRVDGTERAWPVSTGTGNFLRRTPDGDKLFYRARPNEMAAAEIDTTPTLLEAAGTVMTSNRVMAFNTLDELKDRGKEAKR